MKPIHLTLAQVVTAAAKAYKEGRLIAQQPIKDINQYRSEDGHPCAIGAAISDDDAKALDTHPIGEYAVGALVNEGIITTDHVEDLAHLQSAHDTWNLCRRGGLQYVKKEGYFLRTLRSLVLKIYDL